MIRIIVFFALLASGFITPARADQNIVPPVLPKTDLKSELSLKETAQSDSMIDALRLRLRDGRIIQLAGIEIPGMDSYEPSDNAVAAYQAMQTLLAEAPVRLYLTRDSKRGRVNRMNYQLAHIQLAEGDIWAQGALIGGGLARAMPTASNPEMAAEMYALEAQARKEKRGLWQDENYAVLTPDNAAGGLNSFAIVEGAVLRTAIAKNTLYLNFGDNWRDDFTVAIAPDVRRQFSKFGINPMDLSHRKIRVRGWLESWNGPMIKLEHPVLLELLPEDDKDANLPNN